MKTNFAYIDDVMDRAVQAEHAAPTVPDADRANATKQARKIIGGFRVHDGAAERKAIDDVIAKRRESIEKFRTDRTAIRDKLAGLGVTALAVCPTGAWYKVCRETGLFVLSPDKQGRVGINPEFANTFKTKSEERTNAILDGMAQKDWSALLKHMFPDGLSLTSSTHKATLILPDPPADVADILCKAQSLTLTVAAVSEAIRFGEKPSELRKANAHPKDQWAQAQGYEDYADWVKRDPIIFTEHGSATAIIAQFGDFPIEKEVVDAAIGANDLIAAKPAPSESLTYATFNDPSDAYYNQLMRLTDPSRMLRESAMQQRMLMQQAQASRGILYSDSSSWTGR